jgi:clan AA aspartic protease (TIGR02281 family)
MCTDGNWLVAINLANLETRACLASIDSSTVRFGASGKNYIDLRRAQKGCQILEPEKAVAVIDRVFGTSTASISPTVPNSSAQYPDQSSRMGVPLKQHGGIFVVPVEINGAITLEFGVDSGAADVSVPLDVFSTLKRTGTIKDSDIIGEQTYVLADGSKSRSVRFTIRSLKVGDRLVENVKGSVAPAEGALLLGQSFLERFKSWSVDNATGSLLLEAPYQLGPQSATALRPPISSSSSWARPATAPNGEPWPTVASYLRGLPRGNFGGLSSVTIDNSRNESDVFVKLVSLDGPTARPVRFFFIPAHGRFTMEKVTVGTYDVRYRDLSQGSLARSEQFSVKETETLDGTEYSNITMTLYKIRNGNMRTYNLAEDEF